MKWTTLADNWYVSDAGWIIHFENGYYVVEDGDQMRFYNLQDAQHYLESRYRVSPKYAKTVFHAKGRMKLHPLNTK